MDWKPDAIKVLRALLIANGPDPTELCELQMIYAYETGAFIPHHGFINAEAFWMSSEEFIAIVIPGHHVAFEATPNDLSAHVVALVASDWI